MNRIDQQTLDCIAEEFTIAIRGGEAPSIDEFVARHDDPSGELRSLLNSIAMLEGLKKPEEDSNQAMRLRQLDDYQIVREVGRGGMGVVFEAIHQSLGRRVALKVLSNSLLDKPKHHARFRREARAAARLRHPNIVSVFGVGQSGEHHYYVMDFIRGMSLREWLQSLTGNKDRFLPTRAESIAASEQDLQIDTTTFGDDVTASSPSQLEFGSSVCDTVPVDTDSPEYFRWVAKIGVMVCDALQYAHDQGVLHRDIKPANLLLDQKGSVWIADFGLAKLMESDATNTGDIVGTPQYMSPESFDGEYNEASESYCVGLTLYELLTLRPAIEGKNTGDTIRRATEGVKTAPRRFNQNIPRDLETVVLKSLAVDSDSRYRTAGDLRDDLQLFLDDRPISARRIGPAERLYRWTRREPALASLTLGIIASLFALAIVTSAAYLKTKDALHDARMARASAESSAQVATEQGELAQSNLQVAIRAFEEISQGIVDRGVDPDAELLGEINDSVSLNVTPQDAELLQSLLSFFDELAENNSDNEQLKRQTAVARQRAGDIYSRLGQFGKADESYRESLDMYRSIADQSPSDELVVTQATLFNARALIAGLRGDTSNAVKLHLETLQLLEQEETALKSAEGRFEYARANSLFSQISTRSGISGLGRKNLQRGMRTWFMGSAPRPIEEVSASDLAIDALESLVEEFPENRKYAVALAGSHRDRANSSIKLMISGSQNGPRDQRGPDSRGPLRKVQDQVRRRFVNSIQADLQTSTTILRYQLKQDPDSTSLTYELAKSLLVQPPFLPAGYREQARERTIEAEDLCKQLLRLSPESPRYLALQAEAVERLARFRGNEANKARMIARLEELHEIEQQLLIASPGLSKHQSKFADNALELARHYAEQKEVNKALKFLYQTEMTLRGTTKSPIARNKLQKVRSKIGELRWQK